MDETSHRIPAPELVDIAGKQTFLPNQPSPKRKVPKRSIAASVGEVPREASMPSVVNPTCIRGKGSKRPLTATASSGNLPGENSSLAASYPPSSKRKVLPRSVNTKPTNVKVNGILSPTSAERTTPVKKTVKSLPNGFLSHRTQTPPLPAKRKNSSPTKRSTPVINGPLNRFLVPTAQAVSKNSKKCSHKTVSPVTKTPKTTKTPKMTPPASPKTKSPKSSPLVKSGSPKIIVRSGGPKIVVKSGGPKIVIKSNGPKIARPVRILRNSVDNSKNVKTTRRSSFPLKNAVSPRATLTKSASKAKPKCSKPVKPTSLNSTHPVVVEDPSPSPVVDSPLPEPEIPAETASMGVEEPPTPIPEKVCEVKCPPFCSIGCTEEHSPLLLALLNCNDDGDNFQESASFKELLKVLDYYKQEKGWKKNGAIFDVNSEYRYPLIHWAAILSKVNVVSWMASNGYNINVLHSSTGDSALHRVLLCVRAVRMNNPVSLEKFSDLLGILQPNLNIKNKLGFSPFLTICESVSQDLRAHHRHVQLLETILDFAKDKQGLLNSLLRQQTSQGDTALHLLAQKDKHFAPLRMLVNAGANVHSQNRMGMTPISIAMEVGQLRISQFLEKHILTLNAPPPCPDTPSSSAASSRASSSNSPSESAAENNIPECAAENNIPEEADMAPHNTASPPHNTASPPHNTASPTSMAASETDASTPPLTKRIKTEGTLPSDYESDVSENTIRFALSRDNHSTKVKHIIRKRSVQSSDGILKQYFHVCNDRARENLIASINMDKHQCLEELKVTEEQIAVVCRRIDAICNEKHCKELEIRKLMLEMKAFDQTLDTLKKEKQCLTDKSSTLDAKVSLCLSVLQIVHDKNT